MTQKERYQKYIEEECKNCSNKHTDLCEIRINEKGNAQCASKEEDKWKNV